MNASSIIGTIPNPLPPSYANPFGGTDASGGIALFIVNILRVVFVVAGLLAFFNLILAGFQYMSAAGDSKAMTAAWSRIWQSLMGLVIIVGSFALAALFGYIIFGDPGFILNPTIYAP